MTRRTPNHPACLAKIVIWHLLGPTGHGVRIRRVEVPPDVLYYAISHDGVRVSSYLTLPLAMRKAHALAATAGGFL